MMLPERASPICTRLNPPNRLSVFAVMLSRDASLAPIVISRPAVKADSVNCAGVWPALTALARFSWS